MKKNSDLAAVRTDIAAAKAEHATLVQHMGRCDQPQATAAIDAFTASAASALTQRLQHAVSVGDFSEALTVWARPDGRIDLAPLMAALFGPDVLRAALMQHVGDLDSAATTADRRTRLAEVAARLDDLETAEENIICGLESQGLTVDRRGDARPEIVLAIRN